MKLLGFNINISRAKTAVRRSVSISPGVDWLTGGSGETGGATMTNAYQQVVWVYRAINLLAEQVANIPFLFSTGGRGRENLITSGPLLDFYARPHPQISAFEYWELRVIWLMLRGECFRVPLWEEYSSPARRSAFDERGSPPDTRHLSRVLVLDPAHFQHIIQDNQLVGWRYTGF